jgi:hypothetical protein
MMAELILVADIEIFKDHARVKPSWGVHFPLDRGWVVSTF